MATLRVLPSIGLLSLATLSPAAVAVSAQSPFDRQIEAALSQWKAPGVVITVVKDGRVLLSRGYGTTRVSGGRPVTAATLTSVASVTKTFNATALAMLVDDGLLAWDDPVRKHIPEFEFGDPYRTEQITIRDLITHRAGLPAVLGGLWSNDYTIQDALHDLQTAEPRIAFRERVDYSQVGVAILGEVVARASKSTWPAFVQRRILDPLGMSATYPGTKEFLAAHPEPTATPALMGRALLENGAVVDGPWRGAGLIYTPAGGVVTSGDDMAKYMLFLLGTGTTDGKRFLTPERIREMHAPQEVEGSPYSSIVNPTTELVAYCLGWVAHEYDGRKIVEHPGSGFGSSVVALMPSEHAGVFVSSNANYSLDSDRMVSALKFIAFDYALGARGRDWRALLTAPRAPR